MFGFVVTVSRGAGRLRLMTFVHTVAAPRFEHLPDHGTKDWTATFDPSGREAATAADAAVPRQLSSRAFLKKRAAGTRTLERRDRF